jgi:hypothetical protein
VHPTIACSGITHVRRCPKDFTYTASTTGAQSTFNENGHDANENTPWSPYDAPRSCKMNPTDDDSPIGTPCSVYSSSSRHTARKSERDSPNANARASAVVARVVVDRFVVGASPAFVVRARRLDRDRDRDRDSRARARGRDASRAVDRGGMASFVARRRRAE